MKARSLLQVCLLVSASCLPVRAQTHTYLPGSGDWFDAAKWSGGTVPNAATASVSLPNHDNTNYTVTLGPATDATVGRLEVKRDARLYIPEQHMLSWDLGGEVADPRLDLSGFVDVGGQTDNENFGIRLLGDGDAKISGTGTLRLNRSGLTSAAGNNRWLSTAAVMGSGIISGTFVNNSADAVVRANVLGEPLKLNFSAGSENKGVLEAVNGGELLLANGSWRNQTGVIRANAATGSGHPESTVTINAEVSGGRIENNGGRVLLGGWLRGDTSEGPMQWLGTLSMNPSNSTATLSGLITALVNDSAIVVPSGAVPGFDTRLYVRSDTDNDGQYDGPVTLNAGSALRPQLWVSKNASLLGWAGGGFNQDTLVIGPGFTLGGSGGVNVPFLANEGFIAGINNPDGPLTIQGNPINNSKGLITAQNGSLLFMSSIKNHARIGTNTFLGIMQVGTGGFIGCANRIEGGALLTHPLGQFLLDGAVLDGGNRPGPLGFTNQQQHPIQIGRGQSTDAGVAVLTTAILQGDLTFVGTPLATISDTNAQTIYVQHAAFELFDSQGNSTGFERHPARLFGGAHGGIRLNSEEDVLRSWLDDSVDRLENSTDIAGVGRIEVPVLNRLAGRIIASNPQSTGTATLRVGNYAIVNEGGFLGAEDRSILQLSSTPVTQTIAPGTSIAGNIQSELNGSILMDGFGSVEGGFITDNGGGIFIEDTMLQDVAFARGPAGSGETAQLWRCTLVGNIVNTGKLLVQSSPAADITLPADYTVTVSGAGEIVFAPGTVVQSSSGDPDHNATFVLGSGQKMSGPVSMPCHFVNHGIVVLPPGNTASYGQRLTGSGSVVSEGLFNLLNGAEFTGSLTAQGAGNIIATGGGNIIAVGGGNVVGTHSGAIIAVGGGNIVAVGGGNIVAVGGGNIIATGGGNIVAVGGGNIIATGGGNVVSGNAGSIVAVGGGNVQGSIAAGSSPGRLDIHADLIIPPGDSLFVELAGTQQGVTYDFVNVSQGTWDGQTSGHDVSLGGTLEVRLLDGFHTTVQNSNKFTVLTTSGSITQFAFTNVVAGRVTTADRFGTFATALSPDGKSVVLGDYQPLPHPAIAWAAAYGLSGDDTHLNADPDHDGRINLEEFAYNTNPASPTSGRVFAGVRQGDTVTFTFTRRRGDTYRLSYAIETATALGNPGSWTPLAAPWTSAIQPVDANFETETLTAPATDAPQFARLRVTAL